MAADLDLKVTCLTTDPGPNDTVYFQIEGEVSSSGCEGLALFGVDVTVTGPTVIDHDLDITITAPAGDMDYFVEPDGLTNPAGFGGTPTAAVDSLMQVGGAQNTIHNTDPPSAPTAWPIATGVAQGGFITLAEGQIALSGATDGIHTITLSDGFGNVLITEHTTPSYWEVAQASIVDAGMSCTFEVSGLETPIHIDAVAGWVDHGGTERPVAMLGFDPPVEPRLAGVTKVVVDVDVALDPATVIAGNVSVVGVTNPGPYTPDTVTLGGADDVVTIEFNTALPNEDCYTFDLTGMESFDGGGFDPPEGSEFQIVALVGDVNRDGQVSTADASSVKARLEHVVTDDNCQYDVNNDGQVSTADKSSVKARFEMAAPACP
jgi:hypothetical protein